LEKGQGKREGRRIRVQHSSRKKDRGGGKKELRKNRGGGGVSKRLPKIRAQDQGKPLKSAKEKRTRLSHSFSPFFPIGLKRKKGRGKVLGEGGKGEETPFLLSL